MNTLKFAVLGLLVGLVIITAPAPSMAQQAQKSWTVKSEASGAFQVYNLGSWKAAARFWFRTWQDCDSAFAKSQIQAETFLNMWQESHMQRNGLESRLAEADRLTALYREAWIATRSRLSAAERRADSLATTDRLKQARLDSLQAAEKEKAQADAEADSIRRHSTRWTLSLASGGGMSQVGGSARFGDIVLRTSVCEDETDAALQLNPRGAGLAIFGVGKRFLLPGGNGFLTISGQAGLRWEVRSARIWGQMSGQPVNLQMSGQDVWRTSFVGIRADLERRFVRLFVGALRGNGETLFSFGGSGQVPGTPVFLGWQVFDGIPMGAVQISF